MRKRSGQKDLVVHQTVNAVVEMASQKKNRALCRGEYVTLRKVGDASHKGIAEHYNGMGTLLILNIKEEYTDRLMMTFSIFSPIKVFVIVAEHYNASRFVHQLMENAAIYLIRAFVC
nr:beta-tubulin [Tanacetum cinerariifolium]